MKKLPKLTDNLDNNIKYLSENIEDINQDKIRDFKNNISLTEYLVKYSYKTKRNNEKTSYIKIKALDDKSCCRAFHLNVLSMNEKQPFRAISNVSILGIKALNTICIEV